MQNNPGPNTLRKTRFLESTIQLSPEVSKSNSSNPTKPANSPRSTRPTKSPRTTNLTKTDFALDKLNVNPPTKTGHHRSSEIHSKPISKTRHYRSQHYSHHSHSKHTTNGSSPDVSGDSSGDKTQSASYTHSDESYDRGRRRSRSRSPRQDHHGPSKRSLSPPRRERSESDVSEISQSEISRERSRSPPRGHPERPRRSDTPPPVGNRTMRYLKYFLSKRGLGHSRNSSPTRDSHRSKPSSSHSSHSSSQSRHHVRGSTEYSNHRHSLKTENKVENNLHHRNEHHNSHSSSRHSRHPSTSEKDVENKLDVLLKKIEHLEQQQKHEDVKSSPAKPLPKQPVVNGATDDPTILVTKYDSYKPEADKTYFQTPLDFEKDNKKDMAAAIPCYNEPSHEIQQTCNSLFNTFKCLTKYSPAWKDRNLKLVIIQDGWNFADPTTKKWFYDLFPATINGIPWCDYYDEFKPGFKDPSSNTTFVIERVGYMPSRMNTQTALDNDPKPMRITLLIKINNRKKHNSHEWFLGKSGFAEATNAKYLYLTDAFTLYSKKCLYYLADQLDKNPDLVAVTGRQRLMTVEQQGSEEKFFSFATILRWLQLFDFELSNAVYNGAFSFGGFTAVVPGPSGLYRAEDILQDCVRDAYFNVVNSDPETNWTGWILANLRIAEDRVLTYYSVIKSPTAKFIAFNPLAVFYFEAETKLDKLMYQRRRWINGSMAGYIYLVLICWKDLWHWKVPLWRRVYMFILLMIQLSIYFTMGLAPGISIRIMFYGIKYFVEVSGKVLGDYNDWRTFLVFGAFMTLYLIHIIAHHKKEKNPYYGGIMFFLVLMSIGTTVISFTAIGWYYFHDLAYAFTDIFTGTNIILYFGLATTFGPFLVAALLGGKCHSPMYMTKSFLAYFLFMPLMIAWLGSYAYARTWDLSWGNRPNADSSDTAQKNAKISRFKSMSQKYMLFLAALNFGIFWLPLDGILGLMMGFFVVTVYQMFWSVIYIFTKAPYKAKMHHHQHKTKKSFRRLSEPISDEV